MPSTLDTPDRAASIVVSLLRLLRTSLHLAQGLATAAVVIPFVSSAQRDRLIRSWSRKLMTILRVNIRISGTLPENMAGAVLVSNHISWLDIWLIDSQQACRFVAKSEVRAWPAIGWLATRVGTLFIERARRHHTAVLNKEVEEALAAGDCVAIFPEGTTTDGKQIRRFFGSLLQPLADTGAPLVPVAIRYLTEQGEIDVRPAYIDDMTLADSLKRILGMREIRAELRFLPPIDSHGKSRRELAHAAQDAIAAALNLPVHGTTPEPESGPQAA